MSRCNNKDVCRSKIINKTLQHVIDYENNIKNKLNPKIQWKSARRKYRSQLNHKFFPGNFFQDLLNYIYEPMGITIIRIL